MKRLILALTFCAASPAFAELDCILHDPTCTADCTPTSVRFAIDPAQFVAAQNPDDPPRRQITTVTMNDSPFIAEAIMMQGGVRGFHEDAESLGSRLMIVKPNGSARLTLQPQNKTLIGQCTDTSP